MTTFSDRLVAVLSLAIAVAFGLSFGDAGSNHPTYVPPGLMLADPTVLRADWWATHVTHYHFAFTYLVAALESVGVLPWGLALGNIVFIGAFLWILWLIVRRLTPDLGPAAILVWAVVAAFVGVTDGISSVGDSYLFSPALQPATIASTFTFAALYCFVERRLLAAGLFLLAAGVFHMNFLVLNVPFFGAAQGLWLIATDWRSALREWKATALSFAALLGPSLLAVAVLTPFIVGVAASAPSKQEAELAEFVFFDFAVPFHYRPNTYLPTFLSLAGWQIFGLLWTRYAVLDADRRRLWLALQASLALMLWTATLLTTVVFVKQVSQLFVWRLAPFAELLGVMMFAAGGIRSFFEKEVTVPWSRLAGSLIAIAMIARMVAHRHGIFSVHGVSVVAPAALPLAIGVRKLMPAIAFPWLRLPPVAAGLGALLVALTIWLMATPDRYNLVALTPQETDEVALYDWVRQSTAPDAQFLTPPDLHSFRLLSRRPIVVDLKALPFDHAALIEWYRRLEAVSGTIGPKSMYDVIAGYGALDAARLSFLLQKYGIDYAVVRAGATNNLGDWVEVYRNKSFVVLKPKPA